MSGLQALLETAGVDPDLAVRLASYGDALLAATSAVNLTGARTPEALVDHLTDALTVMPYLAEPFIDVGSGGGLPGIPIAIAAGIRGTLVEPIRKRAAFLGREVERLALPLQVVVERAELVGRSSDHRERYRTATARAVGGPTEVLELTMPLLSVGGVALLQRGRALPGEAAALDDAALVLGGVVRSIVELGVERRIVIVEKTAPIGPRFPRRTGIPAKRPLCMTPVAAAAL